MTRPYLPFGGWYPWGQPNEHAKFWDAVAHSGDKKPEWDMGAVRFEHHAKTWACWTHMAFVQQWVACATANATYAGMVTASRKLVAGAVDDGNTGATGCGMKWAGQYEEHVNQGEEHGAGPLVGHQRPICP